MRGSGTRRAGVLATADNPRGGFVATPATPRPTMPAMLPDNGQWRWIEGPNDARFLHMRFACVGSVTRYGTAWQALVRNFGRERVKPVATREEGIAAVEDYWERSRWWRTVPRRD